MPSRLNRIVGVVFMIGLSLLSLSCYETPYPLGSAEDAKVDTAYVGDFKVVDDAKPASILIRNFDGKHYYVEYVERGEKTLRMMGYTVDIAGVTFANLRDLSDDGEIPDKYLIMSVMLSPDHLKLTVRNLNDQFLADKKIDSPETLRKVIADNLHNDAMFDKEAGVAERVMATTQP